MKSNVKKILVYGFAIITLLASNIAFGQTTLKDRLIEITLTGGAWLGAPSKLWVGYDEVSVTKNTSPLIKLMGDAYVNRNFALGAYINFCPGYTHNDLPNESKTSIFEFGAGFKPVFYFSDKTCMKIGANVGWRKSISDFLRTNGGGLGVNCSIEIQHQIGEKGAITFEPGFLSQPVGYANHDKNKYQYAPIFYLNVGYSISAFRK